MVTVPRIEIRVVILGNVSAGKTTLVNALLKKKYGEVSTKRTTAGIHHYRIHSEETVSIQKDCEVTKDDLSSLCTAEKILEKVVDDNEKSLDARKDLSELYFDVELEEPLVDCRDDTNLILIDVPGINEAGVDNKYVDYVSKNWTTFDCVILTMDGKKGVNTEEQVFLLKFVKDKLAEKDIPVIILCNKIDDPYDDELAELVDEARKEVEKIFSVAGRKEQLEEFLYNPNIWIPFDVSPVFIPLSVGHAFVYQCGSQMSYDEFQNFDKDILNSFGRNQIGQRKWNKLSTKEKVKTIYDLVHDNTQLIEGLDDSKFHSLQVVLEGFLGGYYKQNEIKRKQAEASLSKLELLMVAKDVDLPRDGSVLLVESSVLQKFWVAFELYKKSVFDEFEMFFPTNGSPSCLAGPFRALIKYYHFVNSVKQDTEKALVLKAIKDYVRNYFLVLFNEEEKCELFDEENYPISETDQFLTACRWEIIWNSILLVSHDHWFCESFGQEKIHIRYLLRNACLFKDQQESVCLQCHFALQKGFKYDRCSDCNTCYVAKIPLSCLICVDYCKSVVASECESCECKYQLKTVLKKFAMSYSIEKGFSPVSPDAYNELGMSMPASLTSPDHYGHLPMLFCQFMSVTSQP